ncbi:hypothetical protein COV54_03500, partial [Candidatus Jorgensenbacteria bacterium CG11_big_fil_rev_8_21_14_0_20_38_23]
MREAEIRKKAVEKLKKKNWIIWYPAKIKFKQNDIFGVFDLICWKKKTSKIKFIQLTTKANLSTREKKIQKFLKKNGVPKRNFLNIEAWGWSKKEKN